MLYNHLSGKAWRDAEELELSQLDREDGIDYFKKWIEHKYLEKEVVKVARTICRSSSRPSRRLPGRRFETSINNSISTSEGFARLVVNYPRSAWLGGMWTNCGSTIMPS